eukprot:TRINITY_DN4068_c0_g1_i3.p1 TRINITY_DN4068_c0_g1~~TRINITY_DN4068_c0_g1_i3.p1  ORF type:complete len:128 (-),score=23.32 TRINITY_DN4068_c0_g1_i3:66-449(-)
MASGKFVYRLARAPEIEAARAAGEYAGVPSLDVGFIHLSTAEQARKTAALYFSTCEDLVLLRVSVAALAQHPSLELRFEDAQPLEGAEKRTGDFPHLYGGAIPWRCLEGEPLCVPLQDGRHLFPEDL